MRGVDPRGYTRRVLRRVTLAFARRLPLWLPFVAACIGGAALVGLSLWSFYSYRASADTTLEASAIVVTESSLYINLLDAETKQRGYLLTGDESLLEPYEAARTRVTAALDNLAGQLNSDDERAAMDRMRPIVTAKLDEMQRTVDLARAGDRDTALAVVRSGEGQRLTEQILNEMQVIAREESERHRDARSTASSRSTQSLIAVSLLGVFVVAGLVWIYSALRRRGVEEGLRRLNTEKDEFLGMVSHELRTPITVIMGNASLLQRQWQHLSEEDRARALSDIEDESRRMHGVVGNMLRLARPEREDPVELEPVHLPRLVERSVRRHRARFASPQVIVREPGNLPPVLAHEEYLSQVVENLLSNAAKYGSRSEPIEVELRRAGDEVEVAVLDRGPGIERGRRERIFEPFVRLPGAEKRNEGLGLGLPICRMLMHVQQGGVSVEERPGGGSVFTVSVKRAEEIAEAATAQDMVFADTQ
jgi:signal transduction histidine kinase